MGRWFSGILLKGVRRLFRLRTMLLENQNADAPMNSRVAGVVSILSLLGVAMSVSADEPLETNTTQSQITGTVNVKTPLLPIEKARAELWELSETEWRRYRSLMEGIRGSISPSTISPIEVLGIHAEDAAERNRYAETWARMMREDVARILAFQHAYDEAGRRLFPEEQLIDPNRLPQNDSQSFDLSPEDRVLFFTRPDCASCDRLLARLLSRVDDVAGIDIYLADVDPGDEAAVRAWASERGIRPEWVKSRKVTLNFDAGALERLTGGQALLPVLMRRRGEHIEPLSASALR